MRAPKCSDRFIENNLTPIEEIIQSLDSYRGSTTANYTVYFFRKNGISKYLICLPQAEFSINIIPKLTLGLSINSVGITWEIISTEDDRTARS